MIGIKKEFSSHWMYYSAIILVEFVALILLTLAGYNKSLQLTIVMLMTIVYIGSALVHHYLTHDVHPKIVVEYILMGALGISVTFFLLRIII